MRTIHPPLDDVRVRKAIAMAYDYDAHIEVALGGHGEQAQGPYSRAIPWHNDELEMPPYDIEAARALLAEAGYPEGGFTLRIAYLPVLDEEARSVEILQLGLEQLGIKLEPEGMTWPTMANLMQDKGSAPNLYTVYAFPGPDPDSALRSSFHSTSTTTAYNAAWYQNPEVDALLDKGVVTSDPAEREKIYKQVQQIINDDQPSIFVSNPAYIIAARNWVKGYVYNPAHHETVWAYGVSLDGKP
jgi:peptide/nickel transport system substrate-binding protein